MITSKDYWLIASIIKDLPSPITKEDVVRRFAARLKFDNPRFVEEKFIKACYPQLEVNNIGGK